MDTSTQASNVPGWEEAFDARILTEQQPFQLYHDGEPRDDEEREKAYRAGWMEALNAMSPDDVVEKLHDAIDDREALKLSINQRYAAGETIGREDQLAIDRARGKNHSLSFFVATVDKYRETEDEIWQRECLRAIVQWRWRTQRWIDKNYRQPDWTQGTKPETIEGCIRRAPGFIAAYIAHHSRTAHRRQPRFALAGALTLVGVLCGRKIRDALDTRTNVYAVCVGPASSGKDHSRKLNSSILAEAAAQTLLGPDEATSDSGIGRMLDQHPAKLMQMDEIGRWLAGADAMKNQAAYKTVTMLQKLWSDVTSRNFEPLAYADTSRNYVIDQPHLCILGTTTPETFYGALGGAAIEDGLLSRVVIFVGDDKAKRHKPTLTPIPADMVEFAQRWFKFLPDGNLASEHPVPLVIESDDEAEAHYDKFADLCDERGIASPPMRSLWGRCYQKARQFGLIYAAAESTSPKIDIYAAEWGVDLAYALTLELCQIAESRLSRSQFEKDCQEILRIIREAPGGRITKQHLCRAVRRLKARDQTDCLQSLIDQERIGAGLDGKTHIYFCAEKNPEQFAQYKAMRDAKQKNE